MNTGPNSSMQNTELELKADTSENEKSKYLYDEKDASVLSTTPYSLFSVRVTVRHTVESDVHKVERANAAYKKLVCRDGIAARIKEGPSYITGFAVGEVQGLTRIVTSSLGIKEALPLPRKSTLIYHINMAFRFEVLCLHEEEEHKKAGTYEIAELLSADDSNGLLLIEADVKRKCCKEHTFVRKRGRSSDASMEVFLHGSPRHRGGSFACGRVSNLRRNYKTLACSNTCNYNMDLIEVHGLRCSEGFAGGPVVDVNSCYIGVFYASSNEYGYVINGEHVARMISRYLNYGAIAHMLPGWFSRPQGLTAGPCG